MIRARKLGSEDLEATWLGGHAKRDGRGMRLLPISYGRRGQKLRRSFDTALDDLRYAGRCQRVGRCMRLMIVNDDNLWLGGIVLGSTFPNLHDRDVALGLKAHVAAAREKGVHPWSSRNTAYWSALQGIVNHARTFVFPEFQGQGVGVRSHRLLLTEGIDKWRRRYPGPVTALDTLCDASDSGLFRRNGWRHVGRTRGFKADPGSEFASVDGTGPGPKNNVGLKLSGIRWEIWVKEL